MLPVSGFKLQRGLVLQSSDGLSLVSLFTGAGGIDLGLEEAGFTTLVANDVEDYACRTLLANKERASPSEGFDSWLKRQLDQRCYKSASQAELSELRTRLELNPLPTAYLAEAAILQRDIRALPSEEILEVTRSKPGAIDLVAGGPPCQPFSRAGKRQNVETADGRLFLEFVRVVTDLRPRWFLFENVRGLAQTSTDVLHLSCDSCGLVSMPRFATRHRLAGVAGAVPTCSQCLSAKGQMHWKSVRGGSLDIILNEFRLAGYECTWRILNAVDYGAPQFRERLIIVGSRDGETFEWPRLTHFKPTTGGQAALPLWDSSIPTPWRTVADTLWLNGHPRYGTIDNSRAVLWVKNVVRPHDEPVTWTLARPAPTIGAHQAAKLALAPRGVPEEQLARQQWHVLGRRQGDNPPVPVEHAYLCDEDLLRLQTFPAGWFLYGTRMQRAFQIGNAVPPILSRALGQAIIAASRADERSAVGSAVGA